MKKQFINAMKIGDLIEDVFILNEKSISHKKDGGIFLSMVISDKTGTIKGIMWDNVDKIITKISCYDFINICGLVTEYKGTNQLVIKTIELFPKESVVFSDFIPATKRNIEAMYSRLVKMTESIKTECLRKLLESFWLDSAFVADFKKAPAAKRLHHAYLGGLLEHTLSTAILVDRIAGHYSGIDMDILLTGVILHDIGKIKEFDYQVTIDYSDKGKLLSHIIIGLQMIDEKIKQIENFPEEKAMILRHMIISHHGTREFGSPEPPKTVEAVLLNYIDEIDAKVNGIREFITSQNQNQNENWTSYHNSFERYFYIGNKTKCVK